ncbi:MAG: hypothetical protein MR328_06415 [Firmicutes bacterium]|nr:hypothetical protein [Bacillota bacterium]
MKDADDLLKELADILQVMYISDLRVKPFCDIAVRILRSSIADLNGYRAEDISEVLEYVSDEKQEGKRNDD